MFLTSWASLELTKRSSRNLMAARSQAFFSFLSALRDHQLTLVGYNCWWLQHSCLLIWQNFLPTLASGSYMLGILAWDQLKFQTCEISYTKFQTHLVKKTDTHLECDVRRTHLSMWEESDCWVFPRKEKQWRSEQDDTWAWGREGSKSSWSCLQDGHKQKVRTRNF